MMRYILYATKSEKLLTMQTHEKVSSNKRTQNIMYIITIVHVKTIHIQLYGLEGI